MQCDVHFLYYVGVSCSLAITVRRKATLAMMPHITGPAKVSEDLLAQSVLN